MHQTLKTQRKVKSNELITLWSMFDDVVSYEEDPSGTTAGIAAMQLWGWYNNVGSGATMSEAEAAELVRLRPTALAMYAPDERCTCAR